MYDNTRACRTARHITGEVCGVEVTISHRVMSVDAGRCSGQAQRLC